MRWWWHGPTASSGFFTLKPYLLCNLYVPSGNTARVSKTREAMKTVDESDVGIFCYISQLPGFQGILKQRYSDFIVNEVDTDGNIVHLTSLDAPSESVEEEKPTVADTASKSYASEIESFRSLAGDSDADRLEALISGLNSGQEDSSSPIVLAPDSDKLHRTAVHNFFKKHFKFLVTDTVDGPDASSKCIRLRLDSGRKQNNGRFSKKRKDMADRPFDSRGSDNWPENVGKFLRFHLYKENKDTQEALGLIGKMLGIQPRSFGFAGTKDKRSISTQRVTVFKQRASRLAALNDRLIGIKLGDFCHVKEGLLLGQLLGNRFTVTLRGVVADSDDTVKASAEALGSHGFINYFGLQRFGSGSVPTYLVGATLLRGEWKAAVNMILDPREGENNAVVKAREYYKESDDIEGTLKQLPRYLVAERAILQCLRKNPGNYLQALKAIPRTLRMMYIHSYQSYLWNHAASMRVQKYGMDQVVVGDLVYCKGDSIGSTTGLLDSNCEDVYGSDSSDSGHPDEISETDHPAERNDLVKALTAEDIQKGGYTIDDIILPSPGSRIIYPGNDVAEVYHELAKKDSISLTESAHNVKEFSITSVTGSYRRVFQKPVDFEWELLTYTGRDVPLAETDLDRIAKSRPVRINKEENQADGREDRDETNGKGLSESCDRDIKQEVENKESGNGREAVFSQVGLQSCSDAQKPQLALKLSFTLPASCYATMAIRELLKTSTSVSFHKALNE